MRINESQNEGPIIRHTSM